MTEKELLWTALVLVPGVGIIRRRTLFEHFQNVEDIWDAARTDPQKLRSYIGPKAAGIMAAGPDLKKAAAYRERLEKRGIFLIFRDDEDFPESLKYIVDPPDVLFGMGRRELLKGEKLAVVGARMCTAYGRRAAIDIGQAVVRKGFILVSGLALGVDSYGHTGALQAEGDTIAVLGCGIDQCYPPENERLWQRIRERGLILSEYGPGTKVRPAFFPHRNRIISGLSQGVILVEAAEKSGSLITADLALAQGRDLYLVPGSIYSAHSKAVNRLISENAGYILRSVEDLPKGSHPKQENPEAWVFQTVQEENLYQLIDHEGKSSTQLMKESGYPMAIVQAELTTLELAGAVRQTVDYKWIRTGP